ncbi:NrfD/PsrC family molybdoenzyme membrane anchor subunit [Sideroxydans lithotrophicus]|uniref:Polysulphide reductase NrfD n=1 Tax=Sideroxydans lithotrophicus (strain ES-1) TaxID=580332 RepID=D5CSH2_SIDLE|nr:NrfD/PsrC family molybdoenzyme membrane anchor subunit [Sideroxydans lithotrophicus]ADE11908.1 Polysulphide reductase NrfD [Sideroxydans lithotrophicus ES-1]
MADLTALRFKNRLFYVLLAAGGLVALAGLYAVHMMESHGHIITGMNNQIVWGMPHVFAIFLIVAASGVLNVASIGSVFGKSIYKARAPLASLLSIAMLAGGLTVLMLDLGRPDRVIVAATNYNPTSVFAWNVLLYSGMFTLVALYLWTMMERRMNPWSKPAGLAVFAWRFILTTGTGLIFAFLTARQAYGSAILPPMFIVLSFAWGLAVFHVVQKVIYTWNEKTLDPAILQRTRNLLGVFVIGALYMVATYHLTNLYFAHRTGFEHFILVDGGIYPNLFWWGYVVFGNLVPLLLIYFPGLGKSTCVLVASLLVILGAFVLLYVFIIGGQAYPLDIFPGYQVSSTFGDGQIAIYHPSIYEFLLGFGGLAIAFIITTVSVRVLNFMPNDKPYIPD